MWFLLSLPHLSTKELTYLVAQLCAFHWFCKYFLKSDTFEIESILIHRIGVRELFLNISIILLVVFVILIVILYRISLKNVPDARGRGTYASMGSFVINAWWAMIFFYVTSCGVACYARDPLSYIIKCNNVVWYIFIIKNDANENIKM